MEAIEELSSQLNDPSKWISGEKYDDHQSGGVLSSKDKGFNELVTLLRKYRYLSKEVDVLRLWKIIPEDKQEFEMAPEFLECLSAPIDGNESIIISKWSDSIIRELEEMAKRSAREVASMVIIFLAFTWFAINTFLILYLS